MRRYIEITVRVRVDAESERGFRHGASDAAAVLQRHGLGSGLERFGLHNFFYWQTIGHNRWREITKPVTRKSRSGK